MTGGGWPFLELGMQEEVRVEKAANSVLGILSFSAFKWDIAFFPFIITLFIAICCVDPPHQKIRTHGKNMEVNKNSS